MSVRNIPSLSSVTAVGATTPDSVQLGGLNIAGNYSFPTADGTTNYFLQTNGAGVLGWAAGGGGSGSPGGANTEFQYNNAGAFGGISALIYSGGNIVHTSSVFRHNDNISETFGTSDVWSQYSDGTDLILERNSGTGVVKLGVAGDRNIQIGKIGLGTTAVSTLFWINFQQTTPTGRGALQFDYNYTGSGPTVNIISKMTYAGTGSLGLNSRFQSLDGTQTNNTRELGLEHKMGSLVAYTANNPKRKFYGLRIYDDTITGGSSTGEIYRWGLLVESLGAFSGVTIDRIWGVNTAHDIQLLTSAKLRWGGTSTTFGGTYQQFDGTTLETYIAGGLTLQQTATDITNLSIPHGFTNSVTTTVDFGASFSDKAISVVTGETWVTSTSEIIPQVLCGSGIDPDEIRLLDFKIVISDIVAGTGFTVTVYSEPEATGTYDIMCIGA